MQHGVGDPNWSPSILRPAAVREWAGAAEACGFDAIAFTDHPAPSSAWVDNGEGAADRAAGLGFCAAVTERVRLLTSVMVPAYRNRLLAAHQLATLDAMSDGRLMVGLGTGYLFSEMRALGGDPGARLATFDQAVDVMCRALDPRAGRSIGRGVVGRGRRRASARVQCPHPPLWIHGNSPWGSERAARYGQGWMGMLTGEHEQLVRTIRTTLIPDIAAMALRIAGVREDVERHGRDPDDLDIVVMGGTPYFDARAPWSGDRLRDDMGRLAEAGTDWFVATCWGDDPQASIDGIERFAADVIDASR